MSSFISKIAILGAAIVSGSLFKSTGLFSKQDAEAASLLLKYATLPSLVFQTFMMYGFLWWEGPAMSLAAVLASAVYCCTTWLLFRDRQKAEKCIFAASSASVATGSIALGFVEAVFGAVGLHMAMLWDLGNAIAGSSIAWLALARQGRPAQGRYTHMDGGQYLGYWRGGKKEGLGVYIYPSGARYEGRWQNNLKHGLGIYYFPKGGWYEGEWRQGERSGSGVRVKSSGKVQAGVWQGLHLQEERSPEEYAFVSSAAKEVANAAKRIVAQGKGVSDLILQLLTHPLLWAALAAALAVTTDYQVPVVADLVTAHLAAAHIPLATLVFGLQLDLDLPPAKQAMDYAASLGLRFALPLVFAAVSALALSPRYTDAVAIAAICSIGPISEQVIYYVQLFQLNQDIAGKALSIGNFTSLASVVATAMSLVLSTPPNAALSRVGLAMSLASVAALLAVAGSIAFWWLSTERAGTKAHQRIKGTSPAYSTAPANQAKAETIPIGIAWREIRDESSGKSGDTLQDDLETYSRDATAPPPEEQIRAGEEGKLTSLDTAGSILADGKEVGTSGGDEPQKPEIAELGSASGQALEGPGTSDKQGQNLHDRGSQRRRRGRTRDQQKRECLKEFETMCNESSSHRLEARSFASSVRLAAQERQQRHLFPLRPPLMSCNGLRN